MNRFCYILIHVILFLSQSAFQNAFAQTRISPPWQGQLPGSCSLKVYKVEQSLFDAGGNEHWPAGPLAAQQIANCGSVAVAQSVVLGEAHCLGSLFKPTSKDHSFGIIQCAGTPEPIYFTHVQAFISDYMKSRFEKGVDIEHEPLEKAVFDFALIKTNVHLRVFQSAHSEPVEALFYPDKDVRCWLTGYSTQAPGKDGLPRVQKLFAVAAGFREDLEKRKWLPEQLNVLVVGYSSVYRGDSGGPLMCEDIKGGVFLAGTTSSGAVKLDASDPSMSVMDPDKELIPAANFAVTLFTPITAELEHAIQELDSLR